ncbi:hypothetical protein [Larsenimonas rhizosphaerae]|uniref:Uncharacterized protein n=1 Tax=Larsenimonas rhizosphaerae TaxID=2944682 RepID=A0AA41ZIE4_9GAMM|nr:hypothetical protein [Larsenimonas rhizosphaerae]MCX2524433.1 hypothetical protein [Larsenimonas rhizosphaerae]
MNQFTLEIDGQHLRFTEADIPAIEQALAKAIERPGHFVSTSGHSQVRVMLSTTFSSNLASLQTDC